MKQTGAKSGGVGGFFHNAWKGVEGLAEAPVAIAEGIPHPIRMLEHMGEAEKQMWLPLFEGHFHDFLHSVYENPVGYALDLMTVADLGAGTLGHLAAPLDAETALNLGRKAVGEDVAVPKAAKFQRGRVPIMTKGFENPATGEAEALPIRNSSANASVRARQLAVNQLLNHLPPTTAFVGSIARTNRLLTRLAREKPDDFKVLIAKHGSALSKLNPDEQTALHLMASGLHPHDYADLLERRMTDLGHLDENVKFPAATAGTIKTLRDPKVLDAWNALHKELQPGAEPGRLSEAFGAAQRLEHAMRMEKVGRGILHPDTAYESAWLPLRLTNGAKVITHEESASRLSALDRQMEAERNGLAKEYGGRAKTIAKTLTTAMRATAKTGGKIVGPEVRASNRAAQVAHDLRLSNRERAEQLPALREQLHAERDKLAEMHAHGYVVENGKEFDPLIKQQDLVARLERQYERAYAANTRYAQGVEGGSTAAVAQDAALRHRRGLTYAGIGTAAVHVVAAHSLQGEFEGRLQDLEDKYAELRKGVVAGVHDQPGREIPALWKELAAKGMPEPFYLPHHPIAPSGRGLGRIFRNGSPQPPANIIKHRQGTAFLQGMIALGHDLLSPEGIKTAKYMFRDDLHNEMMSHAIAWPRDEAIPNGYVALKKSVGERIPYLQREAGNFAHELDVERPIDLIASKLEEAATDPNGHILIVPRPVVENAVNASRATSQFPAQQFFRKVTTLWKHAIIGLRPASFFNITLGNAILGAFQMAPGLHGIGGFLRHLAPGDISKITPKTFEKVFPDQAHGSFAESHGYTRLSGVKKLNVMTPTIGIEQWMRRAMTEGWARHIPDMQPFLRRANGDINKALLIAKREAPTLIREIAGRVDDAIGDYRNYSRIEEALRQVFPFYGWTRHATRSAKRILNERSPAANAIYKLGQEGQRQQEKNFPGGHPSFLDGAVPIPGIPGIGTIEGRKPMLLTKGLNPFSSVPEILGLPISLIAGGSGGPQAEQIASMLNPIVSGGIQYLTGKDLVTGSNVKTHGGLAGAIAQSTGLNLPQFQLIKQLIEGSPAEKPTTVYSHDAATKLAALISGLGFRQVNPAAASALKKKQESGQTR